MHRKTTTTTLVLALVVAGASLVPCKGPLRPLDLTTEIQATPTYAHAQHEPSQIVALHPPVGRLAGHVVDGDNAHGVSGALVSLVSEGVSNHTRTDSSGAFVLEGLTRDREYLIRATYNLLVGELETTGGDGDVSIELRRGFRVRLQIVDVDTGMGLASRVQACGRRHVHITKGELEIIGSADEGCVVMIESPGHEPKWIGVTEEEEGRLVRLERGYRVSGSVVDLNGAPVGGAVVNFANTTTNWTSRVTTQHDGTWQIPDLALGRVEYVVEAAGFSRAVAEVDHRLSSPPVRLVVAPSNELSGMVHFDGRPHAGAVVHFSMPSRTHLGGSSKEVLTDTGGRFHVDDLDDVGPDTRIWATTERLGSEVMAMPPRGEQLTLRLKSTHLAGIVIDQAGAPVSDAVVMVEMAAQTETARDGTFALSGMAIRDYHVIAMSPDHSQSGSVIARPPAVGLGADPAWAENDRGNGTARGVLRGMRVVIEQAS